MNIYSIASLMAFSICVLLAGFVYLKSAKNNINKSFAVVTSLIGIWCLFPFATALAMSETEAIFYARLVYVAAIFVPPTFLQFVFNLVSISPIKKERNKLIIIFYLISFVFLVFSFSPLFISGVTRFAPYFTVVPGKIFFLFLLFFSIMAVLGHYKIFVRYRQVTGYKKNQLIYILVSFGGASLGGLIHFLAAYGVKEIFPHDFLIVLFTAIIAYSIVKYKAMEVNIVFKRTLVYSLSAGLLMGFFVVLVLSITKLISTFAHVDSFKISIVAALVIALLFNPLRNKIQMLIDKIFYKKTYDYYATIRKVSHNLASMFDLKKIYRSVGDIIFSTLGLKSVYLLTAGLGRDFKVVYSRLKDKEKRKKGDGKGEEGWEENKEAFKIDENSDMVKLLRTSDDIVIKDELLGIKEILGQETIDNIKNILKPFNGEAVMPVFIDDRLELLLILGEKLSGDIFTDEDIKLLDTISHQTAIAIKNAGLYTEKLRSEKFASMGMMSATFAHEIRNPLTSIKTFVQLLPEQYTNTDFRETFSKIVIDDIERIDGLIRDLMDFSSGKALPCVEGINITALIDETLEHLKTKLELEKKNINVEKIYKSDKINIVGDSKKLKQAFINIISNGCQVMGENGILKVNINPNRRDVDILITDTGKGISRQEIGKIFDPFYTTKLAGVGLGLAISKKIVEDHGGRITVESKLLKGTTFTVSLPVRKENSKSEALSPK